MTHTTRRTRTILADLGALLLVAGFLVLLYRDSTEFGNFVAAAFGLSLLLGAIVDRLERHRPPLGTVVAAVSFGLACHTYLIGDLIDRTAIREAGMLIGYAALVGLGLTCASPAPAPAVNVVRRTERPGHRATTRHLQAAYPFMAEGGLGGRGVHIGTDANGGAFVYDPWELYGSWLTNPNMLVGGQIGKGKSSFVKTYIYRQAVFPRLAWILDPKGEYGPLAHALGCEPIRLEPNGPVRLNPLTPSAGLERTSPAAQGGRRRRAAPAADRPPSRGALREALRIVAAKTAEPTLPEIAALLLRPTARARRPAGHRRPHPGRGRPRRRAGAPGPLRGRAGRHVRRPHLTGP